MATVDKSRGYSNFDISGGTYSKQLKNVESMSSYSSKKEDFENMPDEEAIEKCKKKIQEYHIKDAQYRQRGLKLQKENDYLKKQKAKLEMKVEQVEEHRAQDAEALLMQEDKLSALKGRYRKTDNPNEVAKIKKNIQTCIKQENQVRASIKEWCHGTTERHEEVTELAPQFYEELRKLKFYGDKGMNEVLLRQINIYIERLLDKSRELEKLKVQKLDENKALRAKLKEKYNTHDELKTDALEDYKSLYQLQRKLKFYESDYMIERELTDKPALSNTKTGISERSIVTTSHTLMNETGAGVFEHGIVTATEAEQIEVDRRNTNILAKLRKRLEETEHKDIDIQKLIEKLPSA